MCGSLGRAYVLQDNGFTHWFFSGDWPVDIFGCPAIVLATDPGNSAAVKVRSAETGRFGSTSIQQPDALCLGGPIKNPYPSTDRFPCVWLDPLVPISSRACRVFYFWSHSHVELIIAKDRCLYIVVIFAINGNL